MTQYSRSKQSSKKQKKDSQLVPVKQIQTGFSALQKTIALVGSIMSILVATITINRYLNETSTPKSDEKTTEIRIIRENIEDSVEQSFLPEEQVSVTETTVSELSELTSELTEMISTAEVVESPVTELTSNP